MPTAVGSVCEMRQGEAAAKTARAGCSGPGFPKAPRSVAHTSLLPPTINRPGALQSPPDPRSLFQDNWLIFLCQLQARGGERGAAVITQLGEPVLGALHMIHPALSVSPCLLLLCSVCPLSCP